MNQHLSLLSVPAPLDPEALLRALDEEHANVLRAAKEWGMGTDQPFAVFVETLLQAQRRLAMFSLAFVGEVNRITADARQAAEDDLAGHKQVLKNSMGLLAELRRLVTTTVSDAQDERRTLDRSMKDAVLPMMFKALEKPLVIEAMRHRDTSAIGMVTLWTAIGGLLVLFGFSVSVWNDWTGSARLDHLRVAVARCQAGEAGEAVEDANKERYCLLRSLLPRDYVPVRAAEAEARSR